MIAIKFNSIVIKYNDGLWWLEQLDGEAMEVSVDEIERLLQAYYSGNF